MFFQHKIEKAPGIQIKQSSLHGQGVFAKKDFLPGQVIETSPVILLKKEERELLQGTVLFSYYFLIDKTVTPLAIGLGYSSLYNHAGYANAVYSVSLKKELITINAFKHIKTGEEITLNYNGHPEDESPVYFPSAIKI
ncbi:MAG: SET domain-containing protein-lysine N-methyltransferase [Terrimonas sp.]|nr:SET domain-containing protein-lysine N-methyltransferase [Terrimonas sp.]